MGAILNGHYCQALLPRFKGISPAPEIGGAASLLILANRALSNTVFGIMSEKITNSILNGGAGVRLTSVQPHPDASAGTSKIGGFSEVLPVHLSECVPLRSHKTALLSGNSFGNAMPRRHWGDLGAGSVP